MLDAKGRSSKGGNPYRKELKDYYQPVPEHWKFALGHDGFRSYYYSIRKAINRRRLELLVARIHFIEVTWARDARNALKAEGIDNKWRPPRGVAHPEDEVIRPVLMRARDNQVFDEGLEQLRYCHLERYMAEEGGGREQIRPWLEKTLAKLVTIDFLKKEPYISNSKRPSKKEKRKNDVYYHLKYDAIAAADNDYAQWVVFYKGKANLFSLVDDDTKLLVALQMGLDANRALGRTDQQFMQEYEERTTGKNVLFPSTSSPPVEIRTIIQISPHVWPTDHPTPPARWGSVHQKGGSGV